MSLNRRQRTALVLVLAVPASVAAVELPNSDVQAAFAVLARPSVPAPIEGDIEVADGRFEHQRACDELRDRYQAADAPVPAGSIVREDTFGNLQVEAPFGPAAVIMAATTTGSCEYQIAANPTMVIAAGATDHIALFSGVFCSALLGYPAVGGEFLEQGEPQAVFAVMTDPDRSEWQIAIGPGSLEQALGSSEEPGPEVVLGSFVATMEEGVLIGDGSSDAGQLHIEMRCTPFRPVFETSD